MTGTPQLITGNLPDIAAEITSRALVDPMAARIDGEPTLQWMLAEATHLGEEAGEAQGAIRRYLGYARRRGSLTEAMDELADVVLQAYILAELIDGDLDDAIQTKLETIFSRGWKQ